MIKANHNISLFFRYFCCTSPSSVAERCGVDFEQVQDSGQRCCAQSQCASSSGERSGLRSCVHVLHYQGAEEGCHHVRHSAAGSASAAEKHARYRTVPYLPPLYPQGILPHTHIASPRPSSFNSFLQARMAALAPAVRLLLLLCSTCSPTPGTP